ncbi:hypothetical protein IC614_07180 [Allosphingosinicella flava]|uniref:Uncharacterized protein n=1 Tax=Allosphingosinicella flava TaxID=2771430 RepID=A0A7T2GI61_9SPHN|nr:hypothetical protein [Sphingosinicella flava]QPQ54152.1 hypothetical protein IC614_07180 [Sphingosinicella flava]
MSVTAVLALIAAAPSAYPADAVLTAFEEACANVVDLDLARRELGKTEWQEFTPEVGTPVEKLISLGKEMLGDSIKMRPTHAFRRTVAGESLHLILSGVEMEGIWLNGCRLYDFEEERRIDPALVTAGLHRDPAETIERAGVLAKTVWEPGYKAEHEAMELYHIPKESPAKQALGVSGISLVAKAQGTLE